MTLIKSKSVLVKDVEGNEKEFIISRFPATVAREIIAKYPLSNIPKVGDFATSTEAMFLLMSFVAVPMPDGEHQTLSTKALIDNHVADGEQLIRLEFEMLRYNTSFFGLAGQSGSIADAIKTYLPLIMQTLIQCLPQSLQNDLQRSTN